MAFFGFEQHNDLEDEKRKFLEGGPSGANQEDVAVYTWGEESYDGLGDALQEGGDELNDETFGTMGAIGTSRTVRIFCAHAPTSSVQARTSISPVLAWPSMNSPLRRIPQTGPKPARRNRFSSLLKRLRVPRIPNFVWSS